MLYYNKKKSKKKHIINICIILFAILISSFVPKANSLTSNIVSYITKPFAEATSVVSNGIRSFIDFSIGTKPNRDMVNKLTKENQELREQINELKFSSANKEELENNDIFLRNNKNTINARVIMLDNDDFFENFVINKGSKDNVKIGDIVVSSYTDNSKNINGALVGKVISVDKTSSVVSSILDKKYNISFEEINNSYIGVINERSNRIMQGYMLEKVDVKENEDIYTSGTGGRYPRGIYIGKITEVKDSNDRLKKVIKIKSPVDFSKIHNVFVITEEVSR